MIARKAVDTLPPYHAGQRKAGTVKLSSNENPRGPSPKAIAAAREALESVSVYPDGSSLSLREALAAHTGFESNRIIVGNGSDEIMVMIAAAFVDPGDLVITGANTFSQYAFAARLFGGNVEELAMPSGRFDVEALVAAADNGSGGAKVVFVCSPNNPTGSYLTSEELQHLVGGIPEDTLLVIDQAYFDYVDASDYGTTEAWLASHDNVMVLRTFSKIYGLAAMRIGYGIASRNVVDTLLKVKQPFNVGTPAQAAARAALEDTAFHDETLAIHRSAKAVMERFLQSNGIRYYPTQGNFFCLDLGIPIEGPVGALAQRGYSVRSLHSFGLPTCMRITIGTEEQAAGVCDALSTVVKSALTP